MRPLHRAGEILPPVQWRLAILRVVNIAIVPDTFRKALQHGGNDFFNLLEANRYMHTVNQHTLAADIAGTIDELDIRCQGLIQLRYVMLTENTDTQITTVFKYYLPTCLIGRITD